MKNFYDMMPLASFKEKPLPKKEVVEYDPIKEKIIDLFVSKGILQKEGENWLFDYEKYQKANIPAKAIYLGMENSKTQNTTAPLIFEKLKDFKVIPIANRDTSSEPLPLFNIPQSVNEAFDPEKIATKKYCLNFWDLYQNIQKNEIIAENGEQIKTLDLVFATKLFHDFQAKRIDGKLMVFDRQKNEMVKISLDWLVDNFGVSGLEKSIHGFLRGNCPNLLAKGLVKYEDFSVKSSGASGVLRRQEKIMGNSSSSSASFDGVQYYIGRSQFNFEGKAYPHNKIKVVLLDKNTGGVVAMDNGKEKIICVFDFISQEEKEAKHRQLEEYVGRKMTLSQLTPRTIVKKEEMQKRMRPWLVTGENSKRKEETAEQYAERLSYVSDYNYLNRITGEFLKETGLGIHNLSWREQQWLAAATFELNTQGKKEDLLNFTKKFGLSGLKSFLTCEFDIEDGKKIIEVGNKIKTEKAQLIFSKLSELVNLAQEKDHELAQLVYKSGKGEVPADMRTELLRKAHQIILRFSAELETGGQASEEKIQKLLADLEKSRMDIELMVALLIATKKAGAEQDISEIKGVEMETVGEKELAENPALAEKLREMYRANNSHKSAKDLERLLLDFETHKKYDPRFHLVYFDKDNKTDPKKSLDNLVGFMRLSSCITKFEDQPLIELPEGERYLGAMNIDPILQKFYFGENFLREIVAKEFSSGTKKLIAHVPENGPSHKIVKLLGFETVAEEGDYRDDAGKVIAKRLRVELEKK